MRRYKSLFISDTHIGSHKSNQHELFKFLFNIKFDNLFIIGDFIHGDSKQYVWDPLLFTYLINIKRPVIYTTGNHDDFINKFHYVTLHNWTILPNYIYESNGRKYLLDHGHSYHYKTDYSPEIKYYIGSKVYKKIIWLGILGSLFSISFRQKLRKTIQKLFFRGFQHHMLQKARDAKVNCCIVGHTHLPYINKHFMNCGDWVANNTAIVENYDGTFELLKYKNGETQLLQHLRI